MNTTAGQQGTQKQIIYLAFVRWVGNLNIRMIYPFLYAFARGMGVDLISISLVASFRFLLALFSPVLAPLADRIGRRAGMIIGMSIFTISLAIVSLFPSYPVFFITHCSAFAGSYLVMTSIQAYIGDYVPYERRGKAFGTTELGWSLAFLAGMPIVAFLISRFGWTAPFPLLLLLGVVILASLFKMIPPDQSATETSKQSLGVYRALLRQPVVVTALIMTALLGLYSESIFMVFGVWMEDDFGLLIGGLGLASALLGVSELLGEFMTMTLADKLGKARSIQLGIALSAIVGVAIMVFQPGLVGSLIGLFLFTLGFEFAYVSSVPLLSDIAPSARATFLGLNAAAVALGRGVGTLLAPLLYNYGIRPVILLSVIACLVAWLVVNHIRKQRRQLGLAA